MIELQDGRISHLDHVFLRGSRIRFMIIPDMLKNAPMFKRIDPKHKVGSAFWLKDGTVCPFADVPRCAQAKSTGMQLRPVVPNRGVGVAPPPRRRHAQQNTYCVSRQRTWRRALAAGAGQWLRAPKQRQLPALLAAQGPGGGAACDLARALTARCSSTTSLCGTAAELARPWCRCFTDESSALQHGQLLIKFFVGRKPQTKLNHQKQLQPQGDSFCTAEKFVLWQFVGMRSKGGPTYVVCLRSAPVM